MAKTAIFVDTNVFFWAGGALNLKINHTSEKKHKKYKFEGFNYTLRKIPQ